MCLLQNATEYQLVSKRAFLCLQNEASWPGMVTNAIYSSISVAFLWVQGQPIGLPTQKILGQPRLHSETLPREQKQKQQVVLSMLQHCEFICTTPCCVRKTLIRFGHPPPLAPAVFLLLLLPLWDMPRAFGEGIWYIGVSFGAECWTKSN